MESKEEQLYKRLVIGAAGLIYFSAAEGKEAFDKAKGKECSCDHCETK